MYSVSLLLLDWFLWHASMLWPCLLMIPTTAAIYNHRTCLTNHMGSISCHITSLLINTLAVGLSLLCFWAMLQIFPIMPHLCFSLPNYAPLCSVNYCYLSLRIILSQTTPISKQLRAPNFTISTKVNTAFNIRQLF